MEANEFGGWRRKLGLTQQEAAEKLGLSRGTVIDYERGLWRSGGQAKIPKAVELACQALEWGATSYNGGVDRPHRGDDRPYAHWVLQEAASLRSELERKARELFPSEWASYAYVLICPAEWDNPAMALEIQHSAKIAGIDFEYKILPVSKNNEKGWDLHLKCAVFNRLDDVLNFKLTFYK